MSYRQRVLDRARRYLAGSCDDKPMAAEGLTSYRYPGRYGWVMVGAKDHLDAMCQANRSLSSEEANPELLDVWDADRGGYVAAFNGSGA